MRVTICHQAVEQGCSADEADVVEQVQAVRAALDSLGFETSIIACGLDLGATAAALGASPPDVVFNLVESLNARGELIAVIPGLLDVLGFAYTGAPAEALYLTSNKLLARDYLQQASLPIAASPADGRSGSFIVKSVWEHASRGLDEASVVPLAAVTDTIAARERRFGGRFFAEGYVEGREFNVTLLGDEAAPETLPVAEIVFEGYPSGAPRIVDYSAKWDVQSAQYQGTTRRFLDADERALSERLQHLAVRTWKVFHLRGYARIDFRLGSEGEVIVDVNANPCLAPDAGFCAALQRGGIAFPTAVERILHAALARSGAL